MSQIRTVALLAILRLVPYHREYLTTRVIELAWLNTQSDNMFYFILYKNAVIKEKPKSPCKCVPWPSAAEVLKSFYGYNFLALIDCYTHHLSFQTKYPRNNEYVKKESLPQCNQGNLKVGLLGCSLQD